MTDPNPVNNLLHDLGAIRQKKGNREEGKSGSTLGTDNPTESKKSTHVKEKIGGHFSKEETAELEALIEKHGENVEKYFGEAIICKGFNRSEKSLRSKIARLQKKTENETQEEAPKAPKMQESKKRKRVSVGVTDSDVLEITEQRSNNDYDHLDLGLKSLARKYIRLARWCVSVDEELTELRDFVAKKK